MKTMSIIRGLAVIAVVLGHAIYWVDLGQAQLAGVPGVEWASNADLLQSPTYHIMKIVYVLTLFDVPVFLFASGLFMAYAQMSNQGLNYSNIGKWIKALILPFIIWVTAHSLVSWLPIVIIPQPGAAGLIERFLGALNLAYFIPLVVQFYLMAPWICHMAQKNWRILLLGSALIQMTNSIVWYLPRLGIPVGSTIEGFSRISMFFFWAWAIYFPLGVVCGLNLNKIKPWLDKNRIVMTVLVIMAACLMVLEMETLGRFPEMLDPSQFSLTVIIYAVACIFFLLSVGERYLPYQRQLVDIGLKSLGIYLAHPLILLTVFRIVKYTVPALVYIPYLYLPLLFICGFGLPYWLGVFLSKKSNKVYYHLLFG